MAALHQLRPAQLAGRKIRQLRRQRRLTQTELAGRIGIQQSDLSRMERGEYRVSLDTLFRILSEFGLGIGEFFDAMSRDTLSERDLRLLSDVRCLDAEARQQVEDLVASKSRRLTSALRRRLGRDAGGEDTIRRRA